MSKINYIVHNLHVSLILQNKSYTVQLFDRNRIDTIQSCKVQLFDRNKICIVWLTKIGVAFIENNNKATSSLNLSSMQ